MKVVNSGSFYWLCHCSYVFVPCLAFRVHVAGDLNQKNIVRSKRCVDTVRLRFTRAHPLKPELPSAISIFLNIIHIRLNAFLKQWVCTEHWI